nr:MAG TPA: Nuclease [Caudoviricetes sp.]
MSVKENKYQRDLIRKLSRLFPGCLILKNDPNYLQGVPDLLILYGDKWGMLEVKISDKASIRPNQELYINRLCRMGFASFIFPENEEVVISQLQTYFGVC